MPPGRMRRTVMKAISVVAALSAVLLSAPAVAQTNYPDKPIRIIVGFTPGSATDVTARLFAQKFAEAWSVPVTVENLPGGGGSVARRTRGQGRARRHHALLGRQRRAHDRPVAAKQADLRPGARSRADRARPRDAELLVVNNDVPAKSVARADRARQGAAREVVVRHLPASVPLSTSAASCSRAWRASTSSMFLIAAPCSPT